LELDPELGILVLLSVEKVLKIFWMKKIQIFPSKICLLFFRGIHEGFSSSKVPLQVNFLDDDILLW
jgi:hypothetical protein